MAQLDVVQQFVASAGASQSEGDLFRILEAVTAEIGFSYFALVNHVDLRRPSPRIKLENYPESWSRYFIDSGLYADDPVHQACLTAGVGFTWDELPRKIAITPRQRAILENAARYGLGEGYTVPVCLSPRLRAAERRYVRDRLISAMTDYALVNRIVTLTGVARVSWLSQILRMGWHCATLGPQQSIDGTLTGAFRIDLDADTPAGLARMGVYVPDTSIAFAERLSLTGQAAERAVWRRRRADGDLEAAVDGWAESLKADGYCIIPEAQSFDTIAALNADLDARFAATPFSEGGFYGPRTKRFGSLLKRSPVAADFVQHPLILGIAQRLLGPWCDRFNLNLTQGIEIHSGAPAQFPHRDQDMWQGEKGRVEYLINIIWPLTEFTAENGATRIWPGSHHPGVLDLPPTEKPVAAEMSPGSALVFLGSTLHAAGGNYTSSARRGLIVSYCLGWLKPFENQWLCYPPEIARTFPPDLAELVGYCQHRPNLGNYEGQSPAILLGDAVPDHVAAVDALRPDQQTQLAAFVASQRDDGSSGASSPVDKDEIA